MTKRRSPRSLLQSTQELLNRAQAAIETRRITVEELRVRQNAFEKRQEDFRLSYHFPHEASDEAERKKHDPGVSL